jgi:DNA polymerase-3 subunit epsilon
LRHIVLDTETTGLSPKWDRIVEIAAVEFNPENGETGDFYHVYLNPEKSMTDENQRIHGISNAFAAKQPRFVEEAAAFVGFVRNTRLYIHSARFDTSMLDAEFSRLGLDGLSSYVESIKCTLTQARKLHPGKNTLDELCDRYGISRAHRKQHGARIDCGLLAQVVAHMKATEEGRTLVIPKPVRRENRFRTVLRRYLPGGASMTR